MTVYPTPHSPLVNIATEFYFKEVRPNDSCWTSGDLSSQVQTGYFSPFFLQSLG